MHLLQVCNVGSICGGTAACAWSITRALANWKHTVVFLSRPNAKTVRAFIPANVESWAYVECGRVSVLDPDVILLHNTPAGRCDSLAAPLTIQYLHSRITPAKADVTVTCSQWLRQQHPPDAVDGVLYQPVDVPDRREPFENRLYRVRPVVGRICTPVARKWPRELIPHYTEWARRHLDVDWEFVGCPADLVEPLRSACAGRAVFFPAEWSARRLLHRWDALLYHHPTLTESFGRTVAEGLLAGCVPIVDDRGGFREQFSPEAGFLCRSISDFDAALEKLRDPLARRAHSRAASQEGQSRFSGAAFACRFRRLLSAALDAVE